MDEVMKWKDGLKQMRKKTNEENANEPVNARMTLMLLLLQMVVVVFVVTATTTMDD